jgi:multidrug efflux pump subunit AcrB
VVNLEPKELYANGLSPVDIGNALATTNVVIPSGTARMGNYEYDIDLNMSPRKVSEFNRLPIKIVNGIPIFLRDVAPVSDTHQPQSNVVRIDGRPATFLLVIKHAAASTLAVVDACERASRTFLRSRPRASR